MIEPEALPMPEAVDISREVGGATGVLRGKPCRGAYRKGYAARLNQEPGTPAPRSPYARRTHHMGRAGGAMGGNGFVLASDRAWRQGWLDADRGVPLGTFRPKLWLSGPDNHPEAEPVPPAEPVADRLDQLDIEALRAQALKSGTVRIPSRSLLTLLDIAARAQRDPAIPAHETHD